MNELHDLFQLTNQPEVSATVKWLFILRVLAEAYSALRSGGGIVGIYRGVVYGENMPKVVTQDYAKELNLSTEKPKPTRSK